MAADWVWRPAEAEERARADCGGGGAPPVLERGSYRSAYDHKVLATWEIQNGRTPGRAFTMLADGTRHPTSEHGK